MKILVTGGAGYVGSFCVRALLEAGHDVVVLDDLSQGHRSAAPEGRLVVGEISDRALVARLIAEHGLEAAMHFAGSTSVGESVADPAKYYRNNVVHTLSLLEALTAGGVGRIVFSSTCALYSESDTPLSEDHAILPGNPYAFTKHVVEQMIADFARAHGLGHVLLRYFNACGASADGEHGEDHDPETHLIPIVLQTLLGKRERMEVYGDDYATPDGTCVRDYVHVEDLARAHVLAIEACAAPGATPAGRVYNVGTGRGHSVLEVIRSAERVTGRSVPHRIGPRRPGDATSLVAVPERLRSELGWEARYTDIDDIVGSAWRWHSVHPDGYGD